MSEEMEAQLTSASPKKPFHKANAPGIAWLLIIFLLILLAVAISIFANPAQLATSPTPTPTSGQPSPSTQPRIYTISYDAGVFSPTNLRIHAGDTVRIKNESIFPIHIVSDDIVGFDSIGDIPQGSYFSYTFAARGTFSYHNTHNPDQNGTVIVR